MANILGGRLLQNLPTAVSADSPMYSGQNRDSTLPSYLIWTTVVDSRGLQVQVHFSHRGTPSRWRDGQVTTRPRPGFGWF
jgi:hypothetical protein